MLINTRQGKLRIVSSKLREFEEVKEVLVDALGLDDDEQKPMLNSRLLSRIRSR